MSLPPVTGLPVVDVAAADWVAAVRAAAAEGFCWCGWLSAVDDDVAGAVTVLLHLARPDASDSRLLRTTVPRDGGRLRSVTGVLPGVAWYERETREMFGIGFDGGDDRPLLLPPGEPTNPLRRDVALGARQVTPWPGAAEPGGRSRRRARPAGVVDDAAAPS